MPRAADPRTAHQLGRARFAALELLAAYSPVHLTDGRIDALTYSCPGGTIHRQTVELFHVWSYVAYLDAQGGAAMTPLGSLAYKRAVRRRAAAKRERKSKKGHKRGAYRLPEYETAAMLDAHAYRYPTPDEYRADPLRWERDAAIDAAWQRYKRQAPPDRNLYGLLNDPHWLVYEAARDAIWAAWRKAARPGSGIAIVDLQCILHACIYGPQPGFMPEAQGRLL